MENRFRLSVVLFFVGLFCSLLPTGCAGGGAAAPVAPQVPIPAVQSISPSTLSANPAGATQITVTGSGFIASSQVQVGGTTVVTTFVSSTTLQGSIPSALLTTSGKLVLTVVNGSVSSDPAALGATLTVTAPAPPIPTLATLTPASATAGSASITLDVKGTGFVAGSTVYWGSTALASTLVGATELTAVVPASLLATNASVTVTVVSPAPGAGQSNGAAFTVLDPVPALTGISPHAVAVKQSSASITLTGTGFAANSVAQWNGATRPTTILSSTALQVLLSTADLAVVGTGKLTVISPAPGGGTTAAIALPVTDLPIPTITGAIISVPQPGTSCSQLQIRVTGNNFYNSFTTLIVNGQTIRSSGGPTDLVAFLPTGFTATGDIVLVASNSLGGTPISSDPFTLQASAAPLLALCVTPSPANIYSGSNFLLTFSASQVNSSTLPAITAWTLPSGITSTASLPFTLPAQGTRVLFKADSSVAAGTYTFPFTGTTSSATSTGQVSLTASAITPPSFFILNPYVGELAISPGGSGTLSFNTSVNSSGGSDYTVTLAVSSLPQGTTASVSPSRIVAGESFNVTVTAAADAPPAQNVQVTVTGTPEAAVTPASNNFLLDVAPKPGTGVNNRTAFVSTAGTPSSVVYDRQLDLIFASVPSWNRVYVISNKTHAIERTIPVPGVQTMDVTQDGSVVWIGTNSRQVYALNTQTFGLTRYMVPQIAGGTWEANQILALSDGTIMLGTSPSAGTGIYNNTVWNPATNQTHELIGEGYLLRRSGDGSKVYGTYYSSGYTNYLYTVATQTFTPLPLLGQGYALAAVNKDGSLLVGTDNSVYDGSAHLIGNCPHTWKRRTTRRMAPRSSVRTMRRSFRSAPVWEV